jgi:hypothetical protein
MSKESIIDDSKPNAGRMYDYYLGGSHNFEVDRQAGDQVLTLIPFASKFARLQRWALQDIAVNLTQERGYDVIIDFASGLPTNDHVHHIAPEGTTVIYSDHDPVVVEYARDILGDTPNVYFFEANAAEPELLLNRPEVQEILAGRRKVGLILWGVSAFLTDEALAHAARYIYDWAASGSCLAFNAQLADVPQNPTTSQIEEIYRQMGSVARLRPLKQFYELIQPWQLETEGFISLLEWHGFDQSELSQVDIEDFGPMGGGFGAYLVK